MARNPQRARVRLSSRSRMVAPPSKRRDRGFGDKTLSCSTARPGCARTRPAREWRSVRSGALPTRSCRWSGTRRIGDRGSRARRLPHHRLMLRSPDGAEKNHPDPLGTGAQGHSPEVVPAIAAPAPPKGQRSRERKAAAMDRMVAPQPGGCTAARHGRPRSDLSPIAVRHPMLTEFRRKPRRMVATCGDSSPS